MELNKRISEFKAVTATDNTTQIPLVQGLPLENCKITPRNFSSSVAEILLARPEFDFSVYAKKEDFDNVDNTSDLDKPVSFATQTALNKKVDKVTGKGLSTNDYTTSEKNKLSGVAAKANNYIHPASHPASMIIESITKRFVTDAEKGVWSTKESVDGAQAKATKALTDSITYTNSKVKTNVPLDAIFTDTVYIHPETHPASMIVETSSKRFVTEGEKGIWDAKETPEDAQAKANKALSDAKLYVDAKVKTAIPEGAKFTDTITSINGKTGVITKADIVALGIPAEGGGGDVTGLASIEYVNDRVKTTVPKGAKFTDTLYTAGTNISIIGNRISASFDESLVPQGVQEHMDNTDIHVTLQDKSDWDAKWEFNVEEIRNVKVYNATDADRVNGKTLGVSVPANAKFTDTPTDISGKVDKVAGKSLVLDSEITRLATLKNVDISGKVDKEDGKSLISDSEIIRLGTLKNQTLLELNGESLNNKETLLTPSNTKYPTSKAVMDYISSVEGESLVSYNPIETTDIYKLEIGQNVISNPLIGGQVPVFTLPASVIGKFVESVVHFETGETFPSEVGFSEETIHWLAGNPLVLKSEKKYTLVFERIGNVIKGSWGEY